MPHVFISYSRKDTNEIDKLARSIEQAGHATWVDRRGIGGGDQWDEQVAHAIAECDAFILALSPSKPKSPGRVGSRSGVGVLSSFAKSLTGRGKVVIYCAMFSWRFFSGGLQ